RLVKRSIKHARTHGEFLLLAHCISPVKSSLICKANRPRSKNARNDSSVAALYERRSQATVIRFRQGFSVTGRPPLQKQRGGPSAPPLDVISGGQAANISIAQGTARST